MRECTVAGCTRVCEARGYCHAHLQRLLRIGDVQPDKPLLPRRRPSGRRTLPAREPACPAPMPASWDGPVCNVEQCERAATSTGLCSGHKKRLQRSGEVRAKAPLAAHGTRRRIDGRNRPSRQLNDEECVVSAPAPCSIETCGRLVYARQLCKAHYKRLVIDGDLRRDKPLRVYGTDGYVQHGYRIVPVPKDERWLTEGRTPAGEHRLVMARALQRPIAADESVHHKNGDRLDNRLTNLELWSRWQPSGQRVTDKVAAARQLLLRYAPEVLAIRTPPA